MLRSALLVVVLCAAVVAAGLEIDVEGLLKSVLGRVKPQFDSFRTKFNKKYGNAAEALKRARIFKQSLDHIESIKDEAAKNGWTAGPTFFSDLDEDEKSQHVMQPDFVKNGFTHTSNDTVERHKRGVQTTYVGAVADWRYVTAMPAIRDQANCGACYSFAAVNAIEVQYNYVNKVTGYWLSEQQIIDCSTGYGNVGCTGGYLDQTMSFSYNYGNAYRSAYPYTDAQGACRNTGNYRFINGWTQLTSVSSMEYEVYYNGPVAFTMYVPSALFSYTNGIFYPAQSTCTSTSNSGGHAMTIVGYGTENGIPYWIVRNSWGSTWGEGGYFRMRKGVNNCGMEATSVVIPRVAAAGK